MGFQTCKTSLRNWTPVCQTQCIQDTLVEDEEGSMTETPAPAPSTSLPSTSAEAGPSGLHAFSGFGDVSAISQNTTSDAGLSTVCSDDVWMN